MENLVKKSLAKSIAYQEYRTLVSNLLAEGKSTGENQSEALTQYSMLNDKRMKRLDKTSSVSAAMLSVLQQNKTPQTWLVLTEGWCGDAAQNLPVIHKIAEASTNITLKLVLRDENLELMDLFLTNKGRSIPKLIALNAEHKVLFTWGPRPSIATKMVQDYKAKHGALDADFKKDLQVWYNKNKGENLQEDFIHLLTQNVVENV